jgi:hypothetical protein
MPFSLGQKSVAEDAFGRRAHMGQRGIVVIATIASIVLSGCATPQPGVVARATESDVRPAALAADLVGTWYGSFGAIGASAGTAVGTMALEIRDDGTYTLHCRGGASRLKDSGVVVANGRTVTLRSSSGTSTSLVHRGSALYGASPHLANGYMVQVSLERETGVLASPHS